jgi:thiamine-monophosphate kinase
VSEFDLINRYFKSHTLQRKDVLLGIGDDCAVLQPPAGKLLVMTADTLVSGVHFPVNTAAEDIGYKSLAVNLSDLAAMGAEPAWAILALTLPAADENWVQAFMRGFSVLAEEHGVQLIGGDTTSGPLSITIQLTGFVSPGQMLRRDAARAGDKIYVSGTLGDAALGLRYSSGCVSSSVELSYCLARLNRPRPRVQLGRELLAVSKCGIDISDGLMADLGHIARASGCSAIIHANKLPLSDELKTFYSTAVDWSVVATGGDDYELCFTVPPTHAFVLESIAKKAQIKLSCIGDMQAGEGVHCLDDNEEKILFGAPGYNHFADHK